MYFVSSWKFYCFSRAHSLHNTIVFVFSQKHRKLNILYLHVYFKGEIAKFWWECKCATFFATFESSKAAKFGHSSANLPSAGLSLSFFHKWKGWLLLKLLLSTSPICSDPHIVLYILQAILILRAAASWPRRRPSRSIQCSRNQAKVS